MAAAAAPPAASKFFFSLAALRIFRRDSLYASSACRHVCRLPSNAASAWNDEHRWQNLWWSPSRRTSRESMCSRHVRYRRVYAVSHALSQPSAVHGHVICARGWTRASSVLAAAFASASASGVSVSVVSVVASGAVCVCVVVVVVVVGRADAGASSRASIPPSGSRLVEFDFPLSNFCLSRSLDSDPRSPRLRFTASSECSLRARSNSASIRASKSSSPSVDISPTHVRTHTSEQRWEWRGSRRAFASASASAGLITSYRSRAS